MKGKTLNILQIILLRAFSYGFNVDYDCLYKEEGVPISFDVSPHINFYVPHNWANNYDDLNYLNIKVLHTNVTLRHPLSLKKGSNEIGLPLKEMKIGWNTLYLEKNYNKLQMKVVNENSRKVILNVTLFKGLYFFVGSQNYHVSGLHSLVNCLNVHQTRYYLIAAKSKVTVPFILHKRSNKFQAFSENNPFRFEIYCSGSKQKVCKNEEKSINSFTIRRKCDFGHITKFSENIINNVYVSSEAFDLKDVFNYSNSIFTELLLHNIGDTDFFIQFDLWPPSNAPISLLFEDYQCTHSTNEPTSVMSASDTVTEPTVSRTLQSITSTVKSSSNDTIFNTTDANEGKYGLTWIIIASVFGILLFVIIIAFVQLYVKYYYARRIILQHDARAHQGFFPFPEGYVVGMPTHPDDTGSRTPDPNRMVVLDQERAEDNSYEEYHYYERYHPNMDREENPKYENSDCHDKNETQNV